MNQTIDSNYSKSFSENLLNEEKSKESSEEHTSKLIREDLEKIKKEQEEDRDNEQEKKEETEEKVKKEKKDESNEEKEEQNLNIDSTLVDIQDTNNNSNKQSNAVEFKKIFKNCYFYINDVSDTYKEYYKMCKGRCSTSVVCYRNRLIEIILKRGGVIEGSLSPYVTHFIVEKPTKGCTWWIYRRIKGNPKQYYFVTAKFLVDSHLKGKKMLEKQYFPKFLDTPSLFTQVPSSNEATPIRGVSQTDVKVSQFSNNLKDSDYNNLNDNNHNSNLNNNNNNYNSNSNLDKDNYINNLNNCSSNDISNLGENDLTHENNIDYNDLDHLLNQSCSTSSPLYSKITKITKTTTTTTTTNNNKISKVESYKYLETWSQTIESECLLNFESMDCGIYMNGHIVYLYFEDFMLDALIDDYWDGPSAICKFNRIISSNSHSRSLGVKKGMNLDTALDSCKSLKVAKYDYEKILKKGVETLRILKKYTNHILSPNYNEYYLQISYELCRKLLEKFNNNLAENHNNNLKNMNEKEDNYNSNSNNSNSDNNDNKDNDKKNKDKDNDKYIEEKEKEQRKNKKENKKEEKEEDILELVTRIYNDVDGKCVIGIGKNMLIAKLASKKCRHLNINSQESDYDYELSPLLSITGIDSVWSYFSEDICIVNDGFKFLNNIYLSEIPGVGLLGPVLKSRGLVTCNDVRKSGTPLGLQAVLGGRLGKLVYNFCFGYDYRCANLPKKQLDFFLNKSFKSSLIPENLDDNDDIPTQTSSSRDVDESSRDIFNMNSSSSQSNLDNNNYNENESNNLAENHNSSEQIKKEVKQEEKPEKIKKEKKEITKEERALRRLLSMILKQLCSVYSLFDKCIINYSITYKCTVVLLVYIDFSYSKSQTSIIDKQSLRHTINNLYRRIKKELGIEFSEIKRIQLEVKDIVRVDQNVKFIDKFLKEIPSPSRSLDPSLDISSFYDGVYVTSKDSTDTPKENICTPTRRLNGWRLDSLPSSTDPNQELETPQNQNRKRLLSSGSVTRRNSLKSRTSSKSPGSRDQTPSRSNRPDSSVDSYLRTPSRTRRTLSNPKGQKSITEYLSPSRLKSN